ncbi:MAG: N-acetylmuramoyl-L-alanine amidase [Alphaproteobacteria bacterium]|jgi:N-acetylmuramoyl-L-alanine amidase|nr:N-acetylmuramoyl-L-alanine amidase [Alphaproteobacteria bacterium]
MRILQRPSPNRRPRTNTEQVRLVVLHATYMADDEAALQRLTDPATEVSCHYYVARDGTITQLVPEAEVAWHAGQSRWVFPDGAEVEGLNGHSLGIEIGNAGSFGKAYPEGPPKHLEQAPDWAQAEPFTPAALASLTALLQDVLHRHGLNPDAVVGHDQISPGRKTDPGPHFPWAQLRRALA